MVTPTFDPTTDPATEPMTDPTTEPMTDPSTDPMNDPMTDPTNDPMNTCAVMDSDLDVTKLDADKVTADTNIALYTDELFWYSLEMDRIAFEANLNSECPGMYTGMGPDTTGCDATII